VGKYLNGYDNAAYVPPGWDEWYSLVDDSTYCMYNYTVSNNGTPQAYGSQESDYQTDVLAGYVEQFIANSEQTDDEAPMFLTVMPLAPHLETICNFTGIRPAPRHVGTVNLPLPMPPSLNEEDMSDKPAYMQSRPTRNISYLTTLYNDRIASLRAVDDLIGRLILALDNADELSNTILIFSSDNGYFLGEHRRIGKILLYEESIRVPLFVNLPDLATPAVIEKIALNNDLAPTIADLAGVAPPSAVDGRSLLPLLQSAAVPWRNRFLIEHPPDAGEPFRTFPAYFAVRETNPVTMESLVYGETLDSEGNTTDRELYDLAIDPYQLESLHRDFSWQRFLQWWRLRGYMEQLQTCANVTCQTLEDAPVD
jgi:arylsulfatase A-like enzyme